MPTFDKLHEMELVMKSETVPIYFSGNIFAAIAVVFAYAP